MHATQGGAAAAAYASTPAHWGGAGASRHPSTSSAPPSPRHAGSDAAAYTRDGPRFVSIPSASDDLIGTPYASLTPSRARELAKASGATPHIILPPTDARSSASAVDVSLRAVGGLGLSSGTAAALALAHSSLFEVDSSDSLPSLRSGEGVSFFPPAAPPSGSAATIATSSVASGRSRESGSGSSVREVEPLFFTGGGGEDPAIAAAAARVAARHKEREAARTLKIRALHAQIHAYDLRMDALKKWTPPEVNMAAIHDPAMRYVPSRLAEDAALHGVPLFTPDGSATGTPSRSRAGSTDASNADAYSGAALATMNALTQQRLVRVLPPLSSSARAAQEPLLRGLPLFVQANMMQFTRSEIAARLADVQVGAVIRVQLWVRRWLRRKRASSSLVLESVSERNARLRAMASRVAAAIRGYIIRRRIRLQRSLARKLDAQRMLAAAQEADERRYLMNERCIGEEEARFRAARAQSVAAAVKKPAPIIIRLGSDAARAVAAANEAMTRPAGAPVAPPRGGAPLPADTRTPISVVIADKSRIILPDGHIVVAPRAPPGKPRSRPASSSPPPRNAPAPASAAASSSAAATSTSVKPPPPPPPPAAGRRPSPQREAQPKIPVPPLPGDTAEYTILTPDPSLFPAATHQVLARERDDMAVEALAAAAGAAQQAVTGHVPPTAPVRSPQQHADTAARIHLPSANSSSASSSANRPQRRAPAPPYSYEAAIDDILGGDTSYYALAMEESGCSPPSTRALTTPPHAPSTSAPSSGGTRSRGRAKELVAAHLQAQDDAPAAARAATRLLHDKLATRTPASARHAPAEATSRIAPPVELGPSLATLEARVGVSPPPRPADELTHLPEGVSTLDALLASIEAEVTGSTVRAVLRATAEAEERAQAAAAPPPPPPPPPPMPLPQSTNTSIESTPSQSLNSTMALDAALPPAGSDVWASAAASLPGYSTSPARMVQSADVDEQMRPFESALTRSRSRSREYVPPRKQAALFVYDERQERVMSIAAAGRQTERGGEAPAAGPTKAPSAGVRRLLANAAASASTRVPVAAPSRLPPPAPPGALLVATATSTTPHAAAATVDAPPMESLPSTIATAMTAAALHAAVATSPRDDRPPVLTDPEGALSPVVRSGSLGDELDDDANGRSSFVSVGSIPSRMMPRGVLAAITEDSEALERSETASTTGSVSFADAESSDAFLRSKGSPLKRPSHGPSASS